MTDLNGGALFNTEFGIRHRGSTVPERSGVALSFCRRHDKNCLLEMCYALVFPSHLRSEAFGISLLEASMHAKPMISCEIGTGTTYVNIHEETGLVVPPNSPMALRNSMRRLWENPDEARRFGANAQQRFNALFTADAMCASVAQVYRDLTSSTTS